MTKDIRKQVWDRAFDNLDENGDTIVQPRKIKSDAKVNVARANRLKNQTPKFKKLLSQALKGKEKPKDFGSKISRALTGVKKSDTHKKNLSESRKNLPPASQETRDKISYSNTGKKRSADSKKFMSDRKTEYWSKVDEKTKSQIAKKIKESKLENSDCVLTEFGVFRSRSHAIEYFNQITETTSGKDYITGKFNSFPDLYRYISQEDFVKLSKKKYIDISYLRGCSTQELTAFSKADTLGYIKTSLGVFRNKKEAAKAHEQAEGIQISNNFNWFKKMSQQYPKHFCIVSRLDYLKHHNLLKK